MVIPDSTEVILQTAAKLTQETLDLPVTFRHCCRIASSLAFYEVCVLRHCPFDAKNAEDLDLEPAMFVTQEILAVPGQLLLIFCQEEHLVDTAQLSVVLPDNMLFPTQVPELIDENWVKRNRASLMAWLSLTPRQRLIRACDESIRLIHANDHVALQDAIPTLELILTACLRHQAAEAVSDTADAQAELYLSTRQLENTIRELIKTLRIEGLLVKLDAYGTEALKKALDSVYKVLYHRERTVKEAIGLRIHDVMPSSGEKGLTRRFDLQALRKLV